MEEEKSIFEKIGTVAAVVLAYTMGISIHSFKEGQGKSQAVNHAQSLIAREVSQEPPLSQSGRYRRPASESGELKQKPSFLNLIEALRNKTPYGDWNVDMFEKDRSTIFVSGGHLVLPPERSREEIPRLAFEVVKVTAPAFALDSKNLKPVRSTASRTYKFPLKFDGYEVFGQEVTIVLGDEDGRVSSISTEFLESPKIINRIRLNHLEVLNILRKSYSSKKAHTKISQIPKLYIKPDNEVIYVWEARTQLRNSRESFISLIDAEDGSVANSFRLSGRKNPRKL